MGIGTAIVMSRVVAEIGLHEPQKTLARGGIGTSPGNLFVFADL